MDDDAYADTPLRRPPARDYDALDDDLSLRQPTSEEKSLALFCHLGGYFTSFILPLILWLMKKEESKFIAHHGKESLNFQLTQIVLFGVLGVLMAAGIAVGYAANVPALAGITVAVGVLAILGFALLELVLIIIATIAAGRGDYYRYPVCIRFF